MSYVRFGTMRTRPGEAATVVATLRAGAPGLRRHGCSHYLVSVDAGDPDVVQVYEVWDSRESHLASLRLDETREAIADTMPRLTGEFTTNEGTLAGGLGA